MVYVSKFSHTGQWKIPLNIYLNNLVYQLIKLTYLEIQEGTLYYHYMSTTAVEQNTV